MSQIVRIHNALPSRGHDPPTSPITIADPSVKTPPDLSMIRVMLCRCIARIEVAPKHMKITKLSGTGYEAAYLGYDEKRKAHFVYVLELNRITSVVPKEVQFHETETAKWQLEGPRHIHLSYFDADKELSAPASSQHEPRQQNKDIAEKIRILNKKKYGYP